MLAALDGHVVVLHGHHTGLALVGSRPGAGPVRLRSGGLVPGEGELPDLQLAAAPETRDV